MKKAYTLIFLIIFISVSGQDDKKAFQDLKQLEGKWIGTLNLSNGESKPLNLEYSIRSNGSALVEESNEGGMEMMTIINLQNDKILSTHYCGAKNRPVAELKSNKNGIIKFITNHERSGLNMNKESFWVHGNLILCQVIKINSLINTLQLDLIHLKLKLK